VERTQNITACVFIKNDGKVLIAKRAATKSFLPGKYELPGGHVEFGETAEEALKRELIEEMKVEIDIEMPFHAFTYVRDGGTTHCIDVDYFAHLKDGQKITINPEDHSEYRWISESEIAKYFDNNDDEATAVRKGFEILAKMK
jgi:8-oxo-dGTP diphosphatase